MSPRDVKCSVQTTGKKFSKIAKKNKKQSNMFLNPLLENISSVQIKTAPVNKSVNTCFFFKNCQKQNNPNPNPNPNPPNPTQPEQNRTEQNRTEQNRTEQNRTEQNRTNQNKSKQNKTKTKTIKHVLESLAGKYIFCANKNCTCK